MPGPLPNAERRRTNAPTIPTTNLPAGGRRGPTPKLPRWLALGPAGRGWWAWAWRTPQAAAWSDGDLITVAHRAQLEDQLRDAEAKAPMLRECRELDDRLGLTPKGMAALRWKIIEDAPLTETAQGIANLDDRRLRLTGSGA